MFYSPQQETSMQTSFRVDRYRENDADRTRTRWRRLNPYFVQGTLFQVYLEVCGARI